MIELEALEKYHALGKEAKKTSKKLDAITEKITKLEAKQSELESQLQDLNHKKRRKLISNIMKAYDYKSEMEGDGVRIESKRNW